MPTLFDPSNTARVLLVDEFGVPYKATGGGGGSVVIQVNGVNTADQTTANFIDSASVTVANPSGADIQFTAVGGGSGTVTQINTTAPIQGGPITTTGTISITQASAVANGYLSSTDWSTFNNKQAAGNYLVDPGGNGVVVRTALNTTTNRTITGTTNRVTVTNGDGVAGNPTLTVPDSAQLNIAKVVNLTTNGIVRVGSGDGTLSSAELSGDVTTSGSNATTIANNAVTTAKILDANVTYAKIQDVSAASKLLGRGDSGSGDVQEIALGTGLSMSGTTLNASGSGSATGTWSSIGNLSTNNTGTPLTQFDLVASQVILWNPSDNTIVIQNSPATKTNNTSTAGSTAGGRDQAGAFSASSWIHFYWIWNGSTLSSVSSAVPPMTGPTLPATYTHWAYAGAVRFNGSSQLLPVRFDADLSYYMINFGGVNRMLNAGTATSMTAIDLSSIMPPNSRKFLGQWSDLSANVGVSAVKQIYYRPTGSGLSGIAVTFGSTGSVSSTENYIQQISTLLTDSAQSIDYMNVAPGGTPTYAAYLDVMGYYMPNNSR